MGVIRPNVPVITRLLNIFDPSMFPRAISPSPFNIAINGVDNSGRLVPMAIIVRPITGSVKCVRAENSVAPFISNRLPSINRTPPLKTYK